MKTFKIFSVLLFLSLWGFSQLQEVQKIYPNDGASEDEFGNAVYLEGNRLFVGAYYSSDAFSTGGKAYFYEYDGNNWIMRQIIMPVEDMLAGDHFGAVIKAYEDMLMITANADDTNGYYEVGSVYFFKYDTTSGQWEKIQKVVYDNLNDDDNFGWSIDLYENIAVIGSPGYLSNKGAVFVYVYDGTSWNYSTTIQADDLAFGDMFGSSVAFDGHYLLVGAEGYTSAQGAAYIFEYDSTNNSWTQVTKLTASDGSNNDYFGHACDIENNIAVIGAYGKNDNTGCAYVYEFDGTNWTYTATLTASDATETDYFGQSLDLYQNSVLVGAWAKGDMVGAAYLFTKENGSWQQTQKLTASDGGYNDRFGYSVSYTGGNAAIGAHYDSPMGDYSGSVYMFASPAPVITQQPENQEICENSDVSFSISADYATTFQWQKDGQNLTDNGHFSGTNTATLQISSATTDDEGTYTCVVGNSSGTVVSDGATLTVDTLIEAYAGEDTTINEATYTLNANDPAPGTGEWSVVSGEADFDDIHSPNTTVTLAEVENILRWTITNGLCVSYDDIKITVETNTSTNEIPDIKIYPNPTNKVLTINNYDTRRYNITLTDANGKILLQKQASGKTKISMPTASGIYYLKISQDSAVKTFKIVKN